MEYPIIDTLTNAYIRNDWTGLNVIQGKNLLDADYFFSDCKYNDGYSINNSDLDFILIPLKPYVGKTVTLSAIITVPSTISRVYISAKIGNRTYDGNDIFGGSTGLAYLSVTPSQENDTIRFTYGSGRGLVILNSIMLEYGNTATPYEPYAPTTDIFSRTRLPMIRYFPHPVIDSLQRASDRNMTADDVQVLRHYLTKFGIGNIELGRFHAIKSNVSNDIREIDLDPFPIDEHIKEKKKTGEEDLNVKTE